MAIDGAGEADSWWWMERKPPFIVVVMGVSGSGKTEVGRRLAGALGGEFFDADAYHPAANVAKMSAGIPLTDDDRRPWFERLVREVIEACPDGATRVLACSALKKTYRDWLRAARPQTQTQQRAARRRPRRRLPAMRRLMQRWCASSGYWHESPL